jgi:hypothetical protein
LSHRDGGDVSQIDPYGCERSLSHCFRQPPVRRLIRVH